VQHNHAPERQSRSPNERARWADQQLIGQTYRCASTVGARRLRLRVPARLGRCTLTPLPASTAVVPFDSTFADPRRLALTGFLASYTGLTREAYELGFRQFVSWCDEHRLDVFSVRRFDIESFARDLEGRGRARATVARRLCTVASFYRYAEEEGLLAHSPAVHVRRPRIDYESHATALDRNEGGRSSPMRTAPAWTRGVPEGEHRR
jgi:hypothetical protein